MTCPEQRHDLVPTIHRCVRCDNGEGQISFLCRCADLLHTHHDIPGSNTEPNETEHTLRNAALHCDSDAQAVEPASPGSVECSPLAELSSEVSSVVNSSMIPMIRSASAGAMPGIFSKSSRSRALMSFSVR